MRIRIGDTWYEPRVGLDIVIEFTDRDKLLIEKMGVDDNRMGYFHNDDHRTQEEKVNAIRKD